MTEQIEQHQDAETRERGRAILANVAQATNADDAYFAPVRDDEDVFRSLYLTPRAGVVPEHLLSDDVAHELRADIRALYGQVFNGVRDALVDSSDGRPIWVVVDPHPDDDTFAIVCTDKSVLLRHASSASRFWWEDDEAMATELGRWYSDAAGRLAAEAAGPTSYGIRNTL